MSVLLWVAVVIAAELAIALALGRWIKYRTAVQAWREEPWLPYDRRRWRP